MSARMMSADDMARLLAYARQHGLSDAELAGLAIGCPQHGNASMDFDDAGVFCHACQRPPMSCEYECAGEHIACCEYGS